MSFLSRWMRSYVSLALVKKTNRFERRCESDLAPKPRGSGAFIFSSQSQPSKHYNLMAYIGAEARVTRSHGHGTSKKRGPRNSCRSRNYFLSFGLIVTFVRCSSFMTSLQRCSGDVSNLREDTWM
ncbi:hypothetical protein PIB30_015056 [Stylosanthes scabra]|uniref:Uncharacterized protein n=1 Tax=Stylosanthes scabra TaxID=79078 RepID=A0ABU6Z7D3_9FABA|nr:hypothetical protein [Stylosanthes scabra]